MPKPPLQDVIVKPGRPQQGVPGERLQPRQLAQAAPASYEQERPERPPIRRERNDSIPPRHEYQSPFEPGGSDERRFPWLIVALGIGAIIVLSSFILSLVFAGATVTVYPKQETVAVSAEFAATQGSGALPFERMQLERTTESTLVALEEEEVEERARGTITIFNEYSETPQRLIKNTRFESPQGFIYRIRSSVEVPGKETDGTPGEIDVEVFAEEPGEDYNSEATEFTIPGFEGLPQEGNVYARSVTPLSGGFAGLKRTVDEAERATAISVMETKLKDELLAEAFSESTSVNAYTLFRDAVFFSFETQPDQLASDDKVIVSVKGTLHGILLEEDVLAREIARATIAGYDGTAIRIDNPEDINVAIRTVETTEEEREANTSPLTASEVQVSVSGKARLVWEFNSEQLAVDLAGKEKEAMYATGDQGVLSGYPGIDRAEASVRPFWKGTFPEESKDIAVVTVLDS
jgi:hypothetical protein